MSGEIEGVADVVTGTALARAVEPEAGEGAGLGDAAACSNCGAPLAAAYCGACGQKAHVHRTLAAFAHDALHSVLHFDGKIWRTLPMLAWHPGELTRRYVHGERAKFVSPLALFLFCVFVAFAVFGGLAPKNIGPLIDTPTLESAEKELAAAIAEQAADVKELEKERAEAVAEHAPAAAVALIDKAIAEQRAVITKLKDEGMARIRQAKEAEQRIAAEKSRGQKMVASLEAQRAQAATAGASTQAIDEQLANERFHQKLMTNAAESLRKEALDISQLSLGASNDGMEAVLRQAAKNPQLLAYKIQSNAYKFAWALIPLSVPFVWLLFCAQRRFKLFDHAVFVTYSLCFMLVLAAVLAVLMNFKPLQSAAGLAMVFVPPLHMYRQVQWAYGLGRLSALWRTFALLVFASTVLGLFGVLILALGVSG